MPAKFVVGGGFEPPKASLADLQSAPFNHSGTPPEGQNKNICHKMTGKLYINKLEKAI